MELKSYPKSEKAVSPNAVSPSIRDFIQEQCSQFKDSNKQDYMKTDQRYLDSLAGMS